MGQAEQRSDPAAPNIQVKGAAPRATLAQLHAVPLPPVPHAAAPPSSPLAGRVPRLPTAAVTIIAPPIIRRTPPTKQEPRTGVARIDLPKRGATRSCRPRRRRPRRWGRPLSSFPSPSRSAPAAIDASGVAGSTTPLHGPPGGLRPEACDRCGRGDRRSLNTAARPPPRDPGTPAAAEAAVPGGAKSPRSTGPLRASEARLPVASHRRSRASGRRRGRAVRPPQARYRLSGWRRAPAATSALHDAPLHVQRPPQRTDMVLGGYVPFGSGRLFHSLRISPPPANDPSATPPRAAFPVTGPATILPRTSANSSTVGPPAVCKSNFHGHEVHRLLRSPPNDVVTACAER